MPTLAELADRLGVAPADGWAAIRVDGVDTLADAGPGDVSFLADARYRRQLAGTRAAAVIVSRDLVAEASAPCPVLIVDDAGAASDAVLDWLAVPHAHPPIGRHPSAVVADSATLAEGVAVGPHVVIGEGCRIGTGCVLHAGVVLGDGVALGDACELMPGVVVRDRCTLGRRVIVHANSTIGTDGFGYRFDGRQHRKIAHVGTVEVGDDVEIGSCTTIDRGKFAATRIGDGTKIDNLVQIAHNVQVGRLCIICADVGIAGSTTVGDGVILAGGSGLKDHIVVGDGARIGAFSGAAGDVPPGQTLSGVPAVPQREWLRAQLFLRKLPELARQVRELEKQVEALRGDQERGA